MRIAVSLASILYSFLSHRVTVTFPYSIQQITQTNFENITCVFMKVAKIYLKEHTIQRVAKGYYT